MIRDKMFDGRTGERARARLTMRIKEINSYDDFITLKERWKDVLRRREHSVFSTWEWNSIWWKHFGRYRRPIILIAEDNDRVLGIAPLMYSTHKMLGLRMGKIEFIGTPDSDYGDFILTEKGEECMKLLIDYISNNISEKWDYIELMEVPETSKSLMYLDKISENVNLVHKHVCSECPYGPLPKSLETFYDNLKSKFKKNLRRTLRQLQEKHIVEFKEYSKTEIKNGMGILFDLHQKRWETKGQRGVFSDKKIREFHLDIARTFSERGWLSLFSLMADSKAIASFYGFRYNSKVYAYLYGMDPAYQRFSVGNLLLLRIMEKSIKEGLTEFDFLRGKEEYKYRWNSLTRKNFKVVLIRRGLQSYIHNYLSRKYWSMGSRAKYFLKSRSG